MDPWRVASGGVCDRTGMGGGRGHVGVAVDATLKDIEVDEIERVHEVWR